jgi:hypothetical protein
MENSNKRGAEEDVENSEERRTLCPKEPEQRPLLQGSRIQRRKERIRQETWILKNLTEF